MKTKAVLLEVMVLCVFLLSASSCAYSKGNELETTSGNDSGQASEGVLTIADDQQSFTLQHSQTVRSGVLYVPKSIDPRQPISLLIGLHGRGSNGSNFGSVGFDAYAGRLNFIAAYPDGVGGEWEINTGASGQYDDIGFIRVLIESLVRHYRVDPQRVYVAGHSMGGFMAYRLAYELSDLIAAIAPVAGLFVEHRGEGQSANSKPVGLIHLHALDDSVVPVNGYPGYAMSAGASIDYWISRNKNALTPERSATPSGAQRSDWGEGGAPVASVLFTSGGHAWQTAMTDAIMEFFYYYPTRAIKITTPPDAFPAIMNEAGSLSFIPIVSGAEKIQRLDVVSGGEILATSDRAPFRMNFQTMLKRHYLLEMIATLNDGTTLRSPSTRSLLVVPQNLALLSTAHSSSDESDQHSAKMAIDNDLSTRWSSSFADPQDLTLSFGSARTISAMTIMWEIASGAVYEIQVSMDGNAWKTVHRQTSGNGGIEIIEFPSEECRFVRLHGEKRSTVWGYSLWEMMLHP